MTGVTTAPLPDEPEREHEPEHEPEGAEAGEVAGGGGGAGAGAGAGPGERALAVLAMERRRYRHQGAKEQAVRDELGLSAARYHQLLNALLDDPAALAADPVLVNRLRRLRHARTTDLPR